MRQWQWSDIERYRGRWPLFFLSFESLLTFVLGFYAWVLWRGQTFQVSRNFLLLANLTHQDERPWACAALGLFILPLVAVAMDHGGVRAVSLLLQGGLFGLMALSSHGQQPNSLGWPFFFVAAVWCLGRLALLLRPRAREVYREALDKVDRLVWGQERRGEAE